MQLDESIRAELEVTCSTHPDNPFFVSNEVTTRTDSRHFDSPADGRLFKDIKHGSFVSNEVTTCSDSRHFDSPVERRLFEDVAGVSGNRCIKHGSCSTVVDWQTTVSVFFQHPDISKYIFPFPTSPAIKDTLGAYRPTSGTGSLNSVEIRCAVPETFARERKRVRSAGNRVVVGEVRKTTTISLSTRMNSTCVSQIRPRSDLPFSINAPTNGQAERQTDRQTDTFVLYIETYLLSIHSHTGTYLYFIPLHPCFFTKKKRSSLTLR